MPSRPIVLPLVSFITAIALLVSGWHWLGRDIALEDAVPPGRKLQCASYTPFAKDQSPLEPFFISTEQIDRDFTQLAKYFDCVRIYSVLGLERIPAVAAKHGLKVMAGAWVSAEAAITEAELKGLIKLANDYPDVITAVIVGNEVLLRREATDDQLVAHIERIKASVKQPVTYADVWSFWLQHPSVAHAVDFMTIHLLPYWEDDPHGIDQAIAAVANARAEIAAAFPGKDILIGETGWPSEGRQRQDAVPSRENQALFIRNFVHLADQNGWRYNLIEAFDQPWKRLHEGTVGGYWGLFDTHREDKRVLAGAVSNVPDWRLWAGASLGLAVVLVLLGGAPTVAAPWIAATAAGLAAWHLREGTLNCRNWAEWAWLVAELVAMLGIALLWLARENRTITGWRAALAQRQGMLLMLAGFLAATITLGLVFEPRYRGFPWPAYLLPALALWRLQPLGDTRFRLLGGLVLAGVPLVGWQEGLLNQQAMLWCAVFALLGAGLWRQGARR